MQYGESEIDRYIMDDSLIHKAARRVYTVEREKEEGGKKLVS
jgi:hypothetical protein